MDKRDYITQIDNLTAEDIVSGILNGIVTFKELRATGDFGFDKQRKVKAILKKNDDQAFQNAYTIEELENYLYAFGESAYHIEAAQNKIEELKQFNEEQNSLHEERDRMLQEIKKDINEYTPGEVLEYFDSETINNLCKELNINVHLLENFVEPNLRFNDIPEFEYEVPVGYTDVFFWGIPSSGKTCALAAIFNTMKVNYSIETPDIERKFGATYRDSLINIFRQDIGYLPGRTSMERTQYIPFQLFRRGENKKRKISFFELSGEVFRYFYEVVNNTEIFEADDRINIDKSFQALEILLGSNNQKIHFFFIDYNQETKHKIDKFDLTQSNYLEAAAAYFRDNNGIFKKKTDAVYVVVTKSDEIKGETSEKAEIAKSFLEENFGSFMDVLQEQCKANSVDFKVKLFSIGDVFFKFICKINRDYSVDIIEDLLTRIKPANNSRFSNIFNS